MICTNMGQLVTNTVKGGHPKLALADYRTRTDALDKAVDDLLVAFFCLFACLFCFACTWSQMHPSHGRELLQGTFIKDNIKTSY